MSDPPRSSSSAADEPRRRFGTFEAVFLPTLLTILGVILFLRVGRLVGQAGLPGAAAVMGVAFSIVGATALSLAHAVRVGRVGAGGAFGLLRESLGPTIAAGIGLPLYVSQALVVALYVFGFRSGWLRVFPEHDPLAIDLVTFALIGCLAYTSARLAFRVQYLLLVVLVLALTSVFAAPFLAGTGPEPDLSRSASGADASFWSLLGIFFPAATGILAGANLSGELRDPRRSLPLGMLSAILISALVYFATAWVLSVLAPPDELVRDEGVLLDVAAFEPAVLAGLLGATFSSGLASMVGAPRIVQAIAASTNHPSGAWLARVDGRGEPRRALLVSAGITAGGIALRDLDAIATLLTVVFLAVYGSINAVVLWKRTPESRFLRVTSAFGAAGCAGAMVLVDAKASLAVVLMVAGFLLLLRRAGDRSAHS